MPCPLQQPKPNGSSGGCPFSGGDFQPPPVRLYNTIAPYLPSTYLKRHTCLSQVPDATYVVNLACVLGGVEVARLGIFCVRWCRRYRKKTRAAARRAALEAEASCSAQATAVDRAMAYWHLLEEAVGTGVLLDLPSQPVTISDLAEGRHHRHACRSSSGYGEAAEGEAEDDDSVRQGSLFACNRSVLVLPPETIFFTRTKEAAATAKAAAKTTASASSSPLQKQSSSCFISSVCPTTDLYQKQPWGTLMALWQDTVRYEANTREVRQLLLAAYATTMNCTGICCGPPPPCIPKRRHASRHQWALANLALVWYLALIRDVYTAVVIHRDVKRCEDSEEELQAYAKLFYKLCIEPWPNTPVEEMGDVTIQGFEGETVLPRTVCSPAVAWATLSSALAHLQRLRRRLSVRCIRDLLHFMYASSRSKFVSSALLAIATAMSARVAATGYETRACISRHVSDLFQRAASPNGCINSKGAIIHTEKLGPLLFLCGFELVRQGLHTVVSQSLQRLILVSASARRDTVKAQVYEALTHMPYAFFDLHPYDEVEEMVYYVNDMEGVDVHVHRHGLELVTQALALGAALRPMSPQGRFWIAGSTAVIYGVRAVGRLVAQRYQHYRQHTERAPSACSEEDDDDEEDADDKDEELTEGGDTIRLFPQQTMPDLQEGENMESGSKNQQDGIMLRGLEIIAALPLLRPYGADVRLMQWWNRHQYNDQHKASADPFSPTGKGPDSTVVKGKRQPKRETLFRRLIRKGPLAESSNVLPAFGKSFLELTEWVLPVLVSAYGAATLRCAGTFAEATTRIMEGSRCSSSFMETLLDSQRVLDVVLRNAYKANMLDRILDPANWEDADNHSNTLCRSIIGTASPSALRALYENPTSFTLETIELEDIAFSYPSAPTVAVFRRPWSATLHLRTADHTTGKLVCLTGPSGNGKSTLLLLLLGLYRGYTPRHAITLIFSRNGGAEEVRVDARALPAAVLRGALFSYVPQTPSVLAGATIAHNVSLRARVSLEHRELLERVRQCLDSARCDFVQRMPQGLLTSISYGASDAWGSAGNTVQLSGGQAQRLMVARALYLGGGVLLMDEPTTGLDPTTKKDLLDYLRELLKTNVIQSVICATHDEALVAIADEVVPLEFNE